MTNAKRVPFAQMGAEFFELKPIDHLRYVWARRYWLLAVGLLFAVLGAIFTLFLKPVYQTNAVIRPRESNQQPLLGLGNLTGQAATQLIKLEVSLKSRDLALDLLDAHPELLGWLYPKDWDSTAGKWKSKAKRPSRVKMAGALQKVITTKSSIREGTLSVRVEFSDPLRAQTLLVKYLDRLNYAMRMAEQQDADSNRVFMERELQRTDDPRLIEKMHALIAAEFDRSYLVRSRAFEIVEAPAYFEQRIAPQRRKIVMAAFLIGIAAGIVAAYSGVGLLIIRKWLNGVSRVA